MKANIHPEYGETTITCACGAVYHTRSTKNRLRLGICSSCHPLFTGQQKLVDTAGRVEKFLRRFGTKMPEMTGTAAKSPRKSKT
ncbi:50S ribosomal protein L31 [Methylacidimicrobium sp. AP8]|uniref:50S ribosomal protein L31 n=1 Tax=Methylacidimicrobium sp. AP8 TaxID=2730359 RepID=UPI0018C1437A|nr:50S ribosomal protein L31 [Methylacidimicrobium sp. AP8]CAB4242991.1 50S ribosomal protein L31 [Methylacidimicrobium sp. AP8]